MSKKNNIDEKVVRDFGLEWKAFNHQDIDDDLLKSAFDSYFNFFPFFLPLMVFFPVLDIIFVYPFEVHTLLYF